MSELDAFARFWEWERTVRRHLGGVLRDRAIYTVFQPIFRLNPGRAEPYGYEALARFPAAPQIPVGLWFRIARELGLADRLEELAAQTAIDSSAGLSTDHFLNVNASLTNAVVVAGDAGSRLDMPLVIDVPCGSLKDEACRSEFEKVRAFGAQISLDDTPLDQLHKLRPAIRAIQPEYVKVDVLIGLIDNPMGRFNLAEAASWCHDAGITLIAERVESPQDLEMLHDLGVGMAQGYSLAKPA